MTPGSTAPLESLTTPDNEPVELACANRDVGPTRASSPTIARMIADACHFHWSPQARTGVRMTPETLTPYAAAVIGLRHLGYIDVKSQGSMGRLTTLQTSQMRCGDVTFSAEGLFGETRVLLQLALFSHLADLVELSLQRELVEQVEAKARENLEPRIELDERCVEGAGLSSSVPWTAAGSWIPQCAVIGWPGHTGQTSCAAVSHTVNTKSSGGASGVANSSQLLLRAFWLGIRLRRSKSSARGCTSPFG